MALCSKCGQPLPDAADTSGTALVCPNCLESTSGSETQAASEPGISATSGSNVAAPAERGALCAICQCPFEPGEPRAACPECRAEYHVECWNENGGCAVYGCTAVPQIEQRRSIEIPVSYWGQENKPCPACGQQILAAAMRCRHCGATFTSAHPEDSAAFSQRTALESRLPRIRQTVITLFVCSVLPCLAPIGGVAGLIWYATHREDVAALPSLYTALSRIGIVVGLGQTVLLVLMALLYSALHSS